MSTISYTTDSQRPAGAWPVLPSPAAERAPVLDVSADAAAARGDAHSILYVNALNEHRDSLGYIAAYEQKCRDERQEPHEASLAEMIADAERKAAVLKVFKEDGPFLDSDITGRVRREALLWARQHKASLRPAAVTIPKGATIQALDAERRKLEAHRADVDAAAPPLDVALAKVRQQINMLEVTGDPMVGLYQRDRVGGNRARLTTSTVAELQWPTRSISLRPSVPAEGIPRIEPVEIPDALAVLHWLLGDEIERRIEAKLREAYEDFGGLVMDAAEKRIELKRVATSIRAIETQIAALVWRDIFDGRHDQVRLLDGLHPAAVLGLEV